MMLWNHAFVPPPVVAAKCVSLLVLLIPACGLRTQLDEAVIDSGGLVPEAGRASTVETQPKETEPSDAAPDPSVRAEVDLFALLPSNTTTPVGVCASCIEKHCGTSINRCINDQNCTRGILCVMTQCSATAIADATPDMTNFACLTSCFGGDIMTALEATSGALCVTNTCAASCSSGPTQSAGARRGGAGQGTAGSAPSQHEPVGSAGTGNHPEASPSERTLVEGAGAWNASSARGEEAPLRHMGSGGTTAGW